MALSNFWVIHKIAHFIAIKLDSIPLFRIPLSSKIITFPDLSHLFMKIILNIIWFLFGGLMIAIEYAISSLLMIISIIGIPFGLQTMKLAAMALWPFGTQIASGGWPSGCFAGIMNVIWWFVGGFAIALTHLAWGLLFCITIIGIPFGLQHFKLMKLALFPFGKSVN